MNPPGRSLWPALLASLFLWTVPFHALAAAPSVRAADVQRTARLIAARLPLTAHGQRLDAPGGLSLTVSAGYGGSGDYRTAAWVPVRVRIANPGPQFSGTLRINDTGQQATQGVVPTNKTRYTRTVLMPQGGVKAFTLYVPGADLGTAVQVELDTAGAAVTRQAAVNPVALGTILAGVLSRDSGPMAQLRGAPSSLFDATVDAVPLDATTLDPQPLALASFDLLVMDDFTCSSLSHGQTTALEDWVRAGGELLEIGGPTAQATTNCLPAALRLIQPGAPTTLSGLPGLAAAAGAPLPPGSYVAGTGTLLAGTVLLDQRRVRVADGGGAGSTGALVVSHTLGQGSVVYSAIDPTQGALSGWKGLPAFWRLLAAQARSGAATAIMSMAGTQPASSQGTTIDQEIDNLSPPSVTLFIVLLGVYVLLLVPLNFVVLGRLRRRDWSWFTLPALVVLLVAITFGSAYFGRGRNVRASVVSMIFLTSGSDRVLTQHYLGLFAPLAGDYTISPDQTPRLGTALFASNQGGGSSTNDTTAGLQFSQDTDEIRLPGMSMWSSRNAVLEGMTSYHGGLDGRLAIAGGHLAGTLTNHTGATLYHLIISEVGGNRAFGNVAPNAAIHVDLPLDAAQPFTQSISDYVGNTALVPGIHPATTIAALDQRSALAAVEPAPLLAQMLAESAPIVTNPSESQSDRFSHILSQQFASDTPATFGQVVALGWTGQAVDSFRVNGDHPARQDTDLLIQPIPVTLGAGTFRFGSASVPLRLAGSDAELQQSGFTGNGGFTINAQTNAVFVGQLPVPASGAQQLRVTNLTLNVFNAIASIGNLSSTSASLYDWSRGRWVPVDASSGPVSVKDPARFVNAAGLVRARISSQDASINLADQNAGIAIGAQGSVR